jgi:polyribonucleotide nucleotidyltransferase
MDIKYKGGLHREVFEMALTQAYKGRMHILHKMREVLSAPRPQLSALVPQIVAFQVPIEKIGAIIGSKGATIKDIIAQTGTLIDIGADGWVKIFGHPGIKLDQAVAWVKALGGLIEKGAVYQGRIKRIVDFGIFVEIAPGLDGLIHVSALPKHRQTNFAATMKVDDLVTVEVLGYDKDTEKIRLKLIENK